MKDFEKVLIGLIFILVMAAVILMILPKNVEEDRPDVVAPARELFIKGSLNGLGQKDYYYHYAESSDGYITEYELHRRSNKSMVSITSPTSRREVYFLENDTILCVDFMDERECSSVKNEGGLENYLASVKGMLLKDSRMRQTVDDMEYFERYGYIEFSPNITLQNYDGQDCHKISYKFDFRNMSVYEAARFNIGPNTPERFNYTMCVVNSTGDVLHKEANYESGGKVHNNQFDLIEADWNTDMELNVPNESDGDALWLLAESNRHDISSCYAEETPEDKNRCIAIVALTLKDKSLCYLAGERKDRCLVSIVPLTGDGEICQDITDPLFKDDCYIEMAGVTGDESYCDLVSDSEKKEFCQNVSASYVPHANESGIGEEEPSQNQTNSSDEDIEQFVKELRDKLQNKTNSSNVTE
jgi:hypothetical protein